MWRDHELNLDLIRCSWSTVPDRVMPDRVVWTSDLSQPYLSKDSSDLRTDFHVGDR